MHYIRAFLPPALLLFLCVSTVATAQTELSAFACLPESTLKTDLALATLKKVQTRYQALDSMHARFTQHSVLAALDASELSSGKVTFKKTGKMRWDYEKPEAQTFITNGEQVWLYQPYERQVIIDDIRQMVLTELPVSFLLGIGDLDRDFTLRSACRSRDGVVLSLQAKGKGEDSELQDLKLLIDPKTNLPSGASINDTVGNQNAFVFDNLKTDVAVNPKEFLPEFPAGIDTIDRRLEDKS